MKHRIDVLPLGPDAFTVSVATGRTTTHHRVVLTEEFLAEAGIPTVAPEAVAHYALDCLLEQAPDGASPPAVLYLTTCQSTDGRLLDGLRTRLAV
jgi:hypothetical protein